MSFRGGVKRRTRNLERSTTGSRHERQRNAGTSIGDIPGLRFAPSGLRPLIVINNRIVKEMGFDWFDQLERAPGF
jgi:hypothetical protein